MVESHQLIVSKSSGTEIVADCKWQRVRARLIELAIARQSFISGHRGSDEGA